LTGKLLRVTMEEMQMETGLSRSFFSYSYKVYGCLATRSWIAATWQFLSESGITLVDPFTKPVLASPLDKFLMESFAAAGYRGNDLRRLNECRLHLHALRLSDLCSADGIRLTDHCMEVPLDRYRSLPYSWPRTQRPEYKHHALWRSALNKVFL
jgi:hypothetical protein